MDILNIIENSTLIKDDSVQVFKYKEEFIIKKRKYLKKVEESTYVEKDFLEYAEENGVKVHKIINIINKGEYLYIIYGFEKPKGKMDFIEIGRNFKKLHSLKKEFNFSKGNDDDLNFIGAEKELKKILGENILIKWQKIGKKVLEDYRLKLEIVNKKCIIHGDFDFGNIISPNIIIDTEEMRMGNAEYDIVAFFRMGYRYGNMEEMNKILEGYGYKGTFERLKIDFGYKDLTVTNWLILNNKGNKNRIKDIEKRIENWYNWDYKWVLYS